MDGRTYSTHTRPTIVQSWLDQAERSIRQEAGRKGLFGQEKASGNGREFLINRVLRPILPDTVHLGSGRVINRHDRQSLHADIVIYDPRLPRLEGAGGTSLYFVEGVVAAIIVKPRLTTASLAESLDVSASILELAPTTSDHDHRVSAGSSHRAAAPRTYVWTYSCDLSAESMAVRVSDWCRDDMEESLRDPHLPSLIAGGRIIGVRNDGWLTFHAGMPRPEGPAELDLDATQPRPVMGFWPTERSFGWLLLRLLHDARHRLPPGCGSIPHFTFDDYLTADQYSDDDLHTHSGHFTYCS